MQETWVQSLDQEDPLEEEMETHSSVLAWEIPWVEEPGRLQSLGSQRARHDLATSLSFLPSGAAVKTLPARAGRSGDPGSMPGSGRSPGGGNGNPRQYSCLEDPMDPAAWPAHVHARQALPRPRHHRGLRGVLESGIQLGKPFKRW